MFGISNLATAAETDITNKTNRGEPSKPLTLLTNNSANHPAAPLVTKALARDKEVAITKKLVQPKFCSKYLQSNNPTFGIKIATIAINAGTAGGRPCKESVNHSKAVPINIILTLISGLDMGLLSRLGTSS